VACNSLRDSLVANLAAPYVKAPLQNVAPGRIESHVLRFRLMGPVRRGRSALLSTNGKEILGSFVADRVFYHPDSPTGVTQAR
jgi:hypothetical protein